MSKSHSYVTSAICAVALSAATQSAPAIAAENAFENDESSQVIITVEESGEISSISSSSSTGKLRSASDRAPDCISAVPEKGFVQVYNHCDWDIRVKVIFAFAADSACKLVIAGTRTNIALHKGRIDGVVTC
ncbi:hypothetical protein G7Y31_00655 [Corynebacterium lizhenjunii]|uniref:Uncharacterized protein n=1 Tax=Corynebacterium lizhenjunii TaxID=2709394 RepID=A0A7T0PAN9_9CORY|nr:hypothetical protein [Corynebacterium lizhenjunii]QPK79276.1 hypothetical protein G7Y31_00655 [Corynebacterium lizhenjunii]